MIAVDRVMPTHCSTGCAFPVRRTARLGVPGCDSPWEVSMRLARRSALTLLGSTALAGVIALVRAEGKFVTIGINLPLTGAGAEDATTILHGAVLAIEEANANGGTGGYEMQDPESGRRHRDRGAVRSGAGGHQRPQDGRRPDRGRRHRSDGQRQRQGDGAAAQPGQPRHGDAELDQPRPDRSEIRRAISARRQGDLLPHGDHGCLPRPQHGQFHGRHAQGEVGLRGGRHRLPMAWASPMHSRRRRPSAA